MNWRVGFGLTLTFLSGIMFMAELMALAMWPYVLTKISLSIQAPDFLFTPTILVPLLFLKAIVLLLMGYWITNEGSKRVGGSVEKEKRGADE